MEGYQRQDRFPLRSKPWHPGEIDASGWRCPHRRYPAIGNPPAAHVAGTSPDELAEAGRPVVTVVGTVRNEAVAFSRSWEIWRRQVPAPWWDRPAAVRFLVLDDNSQEGRAEMNRAFDRALETCPSWARLQHVLLRREHDTAQRSCTLAFNFALKHLVERPLVMFQWWDRVPGSFHHLAALLEPHRHRAGIVTSAVSRHLGGSSSVDSMSPDALSALLRMCGNWECNPEALARAAGTIGGHCVPGQATESSGFVIDPEELWNIGGWDERYATRASYANVDLWLRLLDGAGLTALFVPEPVGANYHLSHPCPTNRHKEPMILDPMLVRNPDGWGEAVDGILKRGWS